ncbi:hypothetical protein GN316_06600 [Xylophilus sp. Kf1]|nr:hypothetical protein [Xylophilus sp. Kf1]
MSKSRKMAFTSPKAHARIHQIRELLTGKQVRVNVLAGDLGLSLKATYLYLEFLHDQVHVAAVDTANGVPANLYSWGAYPGAGDRDPELGVPTLKRRCRQPSQPPSPDRLAQLRAKNYFKPQQVHRHPMDVMLFGEAHG